LLTSVLLLTLAACGAGEADEPPATNPASPSTQRLDPLEPLDRTAPTDSRGYARSTVRGLWRLADTDADDQTISVVIANGGCLYFTHMTVESVSDSGIELAAWNDEWTPVEAHYACTADLRYVRSRVRLPEPIRGRQLQGQCTAGQATVAERQCPDDLFLTSPSGD
jgi:hypothetical protein